MCVNEGDGSVYSWGRGTFGRLGNASEIDQRFPVKINLNLKIVSISAGAYHTLALAGSNYSNIILIKIIIIM